MGPGPYPKFNKKIYFIQSNQNYYLYQKKTLKTLKENENLVVRRVQFIVIKRGDFRAVTEVDALCCYLQIFVALCKISAHQLSKLIPVIRVHYVRTFKISVVFKKLEQSLDVFLVILEIEILHITCITRPHFSIPMCFIIVHKSERSMTNNARQTNWKWKRFCWFGLHTVLVQYQREFSKLENINWTVQGANDQRLFKCSKHA